VGAGLPAGPGLLDGYHPPPGGHDEMLDGDGRVRERWSHVGRVLDRLGHPELLNRRSEAARLLADDGVDYQLSSPGQTRQRWTLDPVPVLLGSQEWTEVERGVIQRAELLNLILADLYGERRLLRTGLLPPELVYSHPGFVRQADQVRVPGPQLFSVAVDVARTASGRWWALSDRTQTPAGFGYALENRVVVSRVFPSMYRDVQAHRLAPFFRTLRSALRDAAPAGVEEPRVVVLTPGAWSETAFEHAFLASYLGYPLVEGSDLTVRDGRVWLRSLGRVEPVDVILRRVDSSWCDPLELRSESLLGVPGLVEAARQGRVSVVNTLGSGVLENPGLLPLLPRLCRALLGGEPRLPSVPTWWCGEPDGRRHVLAHLGRTVIKSISREPGAETVLGWECSAAQLDELRRRIEARPHLWVGQEPMELATVPVLSERGLEPRHMRMRTFLVARHESYVAMPGGLARVAGQAGAGALIGNRDRTVYKDVWVAASEPEDSSGFWLRPVVSASAVPVSGGGPGGEEQGRTALTSRAAENLFWLGRYAERAEALVRLLRVVEDRHNDFADRVSPAGTACVRVLLDALAGVSGVPMSTTTGEATPETEDTTTPVSGEARYSATGHSRGPVDTGLRLLLHDADRPGTLAFAVRRVRETAYPVRDQLSGDTWLVLGALERDLRTPDDSSDGRGDSEGSPGDDPASGRLARVLRSLLALGGLAAESMVRDQGWRFLNAGRRLERALQLLRLLRGTLGAGHDTATDSLLLESVLTAAESIITYRRRHRSHARLDTVLELLLLDPDNPRSVAFQLERLGRDVAAVARRDPSAAGRGHLTSTERLVLEASSALRLTDLAPLVTPTAPAPTDPAHPAGPDGTPVERPELVALLDRLAELLERAGTALDAEHFTHLLPQRPMPTPVEPGRPTRLRVV
jgi:uncharacterized circularly permuted ATP-grasp superfamily protein/uncharacterized alpha-E superfamily protein